MVAFLFYWCKGNALYGFGLLFPNYIFPNYYFPNTVPQLYIFPTKQLTAPFQPVLDGAVKVRTSRRGKKDVYS
jgi:hypothetical protein